MSTSELSLEHSKIVAYFNPIVALKDIESAVFFFKIQMKDYPIKYQIDAESNSICYNFFLFTCYFFSLGFLI